MRRLFLALCLSLVATASFANNHTPIVRTITLEVAGMTCEACSVNVEAALLALPEVASATVDVDAARATITLKDINAEPTEVDLYKAIAAAGYTLKAVRN